MRASALEDRAPTFANLPISRKLTAAFAANVAVIVVSGAIVYGRLRLIKEATSRRVHSHEVLQTLETAVSAMLDQQVRLRRPGARQRAGQRPVFASIDPEMDL